MFLQCIHNHGKKQSRTITGEAADGVDSLLFVRDRLDGSRGGEVVVV
jgi:hypothetical protein